MACTCTTDADGFWQLGPDCRQAELDQWTDLPGTDSSPI